MKQEKAFTLIELLAVIVILGIIALIATPLALNVIENAKKNAFKNTAYGLIDVVKLKYAENYLSGNTDESFYNFPETTDLSFKGETPEGGTIRLMSDGKISLAIHNNKWCAVKGADASEVHIKIYEEDRCILQEEADVPIITLNGEKIIYLSIGKNYIEPEFIVKTVGGEVLSNSLVEVSVLGQTTGASEIDTSIEETYTITYKVTYKGNTTTETIIVHVGNYKPSIIIEPNETDGYAQELDITINVSAFEKYSIGGFSYVITKDGVEGNFNTVNGTSKKISFIEDGTYQIKVIATDSEGNTSEVTSNTYNIDVTDPVITFAEGDNVGITLLVSEVATYDIKTGVNVTDNNEITKDDIIVSSNNLSSIPNNYEVTYTVTDIAGNTVSKKRKITVTHPSILETISPLISNGEVIDDMTKDHNLRYVGLTPNNYITFNKELWRIIGVFDGQAKIIRNDYFSTSMWWDNKENCYDVDLDGYIYEQCDSFNNWATSSLQLALNNTTDGYITMIKKNDITSYNYIDLEHVWNIGAVEYETSIWTRENMYNLERGNTPAKTEGSLTTWTGAIGLIYPSDYGYSTKGDKIICDTSMWDWKKSVNETTFNECAKKSWLYDSNYDSYTITPESDLTVGVFTVLNSGGIVGSITYNKDFVTTTKSVPTLYLKPEVKITGGKGTDQEPYQLGI